MSKVGVTVMSFIQAREMAKDTRKDIVINAVSILNTKSCSKHFKMPDMGTNIFGEFVRLNANKPGRLFLTFSLKCYFKKNKFSNLNKEIYDH